VAIDGDVGLVVGVVVATVVDVVLVVGVAVVVVDFGVVIGTTV
jgi:hypothetical protein